MASAQQITDGSDLIARRPGEMGDRPPSKARVRTSRGRGPHTSQPEQFVRDETDEGERQVRQTPHWSQPFELRSRALRRSGGEQNADLHAHGRVRGRPRLPRARG